MDYELFSLSNDVPVAVESKGASLTGVYDSVPLPVRHFLPYIRDLKNSPDEVVANPTKRTVFVVELLNNEKMYIFPNLQQPTKPCVTVTNTVAFNVTPAINIAITKALKTFTR